ncbi:putative cell wall-binding protein [Clostridium pascui]|uniref:cell wall-binding repeat-containing protein n=1 Tax=Clostridium pascui TaxID=46609 RepID=UPI00195B6E19|nr:cell wall-binding repeat-containing protein [Clostridium pascui]MBM7869827.1 putative cell wall-binding protein [Clostridium pascui]
MKKTTSKALASAALTALIAGIIPAHQVSAANVEFQRLSGKDRYLTAVEVSKAGWAEGADYAVVANGEAYADALSAGPFAKKNNAPILLTSSKGITNETINELKRLKVKKVYVIGETGVVPNNILEAIKKNVTTDVERIGGLDRYSTSAKIAEKFGAASEIMLASGEGYADALSAVPAAAIKGMPILLTKAGELPKVTSDYIKAQGVKKTFVVGGTASVSDKVKGQVPDSLRLGGKDRWETNSEIVKNFALDFNFDAAYFALANGVTGKEFADALTASAIAAKGGHPVIISNKTADVATNALILEKLSPTAKITAIGGAANLSDSLIKSYQVKGETIEASKDVTGNAVVSKDNTALNNMKVTGNVYLEGNNQTLTNVTVTGTVFINPGANGNATLDNVTADKIVVLSGAENSIHLNNVTCNILYVSSKVKTRVVLEGTANIKKVEIFSSAILDALNEFKGTIVVLNNLYIKNVEFLGEYTGTITVLGKSDNVKLPGSNNGGGGGGGAISFNPLKEKITKAVAAYNAFADKHEGEVEKYPVVKYDNSKTVTVTIDKAKKDQKLATTFDAKKEMITAARLEKLNELMGNADIKVGNKTLIEYVASKQASENYINGDGTVNYNAVANKIAEDGFDFNHAVSVAERLIANKLDVTAPAVTVDGLTVQSISRGTKTVNFVNAKGSDLKAGMDAMFGSNYAEMTYGDFEGSYVLKLKDAKGNAVNYTLKVQFN